MVTLVKLMHLKVTDKYGKFKLHNLMSMLLRVHYYIRFCLTLHITGFAASPV